jgi:hypothetical protein
MPTSEEKKLMLDKLDKEIVFARMLTEETEIILPDFVKETKDPSNGTVIYAFRLGDLREHAEEVGCPSAGQYYLDWLNFSKLLCDVWMGEKLFLTIKTLWKLLS